MLPLSEDQYLPAGIWFRAACIRSHAWWRRFLCLEADQGMLSLSPVYLAFHHKKQYVPLLHLPQMGAGFRLHRNAWTAVCTLPVHCASLLQTQDPAFRNNTWSWMVSCRQHWEYLPRWTVIGRQAFHGRHLLLSYVYVQLILNMSITQQHNRTLSAFDKQDLWSRSFHHQWSQ